MKRRHYKLFTVILVLVLTLGISVHAAQLNMNSMDGIEAVLSTDKESYISSDSVKVTLRITNNSGKKATVSAQITIPDVLKVSSGTISDSGIVLENGETREISDLVLGVAEANGEANIPQTGDGTNLALWSALLVICAGGFVALLIFGKSFNKGISLVLCVVLVGSLTFVAAPAKAADISGSFIVEKNVRINNKEVTITATISYVLETVQETQPEEQPALTRGDLEAAVTELAFAYFHKGSKIQYCSQEITIGLDKYHGATYRLTEDAAPEYGTADTTIYSVCSDYVYKVYYEALGYRMFGSKDYLDAVTTAMWMFCEDVVLMRWINDSYELTAEDLAYGVTTEKQMTMEEAREFLANWEENLRPGDVILPTGHAMLYVGNGYVLDCWGSKYSMENGRESFESAGSVHVLHKVEDLYLDGTDPVSNSYWLTDTTTLKWFAVFRPLDYFAVDDGDENPANDPVADSRVSLTDAAISRMKYPAMEIDRTVNATPYGTVASRDQLTYSIIITNHSNESSYAACMPETSGSDYQNLVVTEKIPAGTELIQGSISGNGSCGDGIIRWSVDVPAGSSVELTYCVKVTAQQGSTIVSQGGYVADIPSNSIVNTVGGKELSAEALEGLTALSITDTSLWRENYNISSLATDMEFAERVYAKAMGIGLELPTIQEVIDNLLTLQDVTVESGSVRYNGTKTAKLFTVKESIAADYETIDKMVVDGYIGGCKMYFADKNDTINEFNLDYLEPGDILVYANTDASGYVTDTEVIVYAGDSKLLVLNSQQELSVIKGTGTNNSNLANVKLWNAYIWDVFFLLRPSEAIPDINALEYDSSTEPDYGEEPGSEDDTSTWGDYPLSDENQEKLAALTAEGWTQKNTNFAEEVYLSVGIDLAQEGTKSTSAANMLKTALFEPFGDALNYAYQPLDSVAQGYQRLAAMLVAELRGGPHMIDDGTLKELTIKKLEIGDILYLVNRGSSRYWVGVYMGEGKILFSEYCTKSQALTKYQTYSIYDFSGENADAEFAALLAADPVDNEAWECYFVLRPYLGYENINVADENEEDEQKTVREKAANVAGLTTAGWTGYITAFAEEVYKAVDVDLIPVTGSLTPATLMKNDYIFVDPDTGMAPSSDASSYKLQLKKAEDVAESYKALHTSVVLYGGAHMYDSDGAVMTDTVFTLDQLEVGDILYLVNRVEKFYWTCIYQGEGKFLTAQAGDAYGYAILEMESNETLADLLKNIPSKGTEWQCYYVLRPYLALDSAG